jgi:hypothetical protein
LLGTDEQFFVAGHGFSSARRRGGARKSALAARWRAPRRVMNG